MAHKDGMKPYSHQLVKPYDAMVYIDGGRVYAVDSMGEVIAKGVAGTDDTTVIQAACNAISSTGKVVVKDGSYVITSQILVDVGVIIEFGNSQLNISSLNTDVFHFNSGGGYVSNLLTGIIGGTFTGNGANASTYVACFNRIGNGVIVRDTCTTNCNAVRLVGECVLSSIENVRGTTISGSFIKTELGGTATFGSIGSIFSHIYIEGGVAGSIGFAFLAGENHVRDCYLEALPKHIVINLLDVTGNTWITIHGCKFGLRNTDCTVVEYVKSGGSPHTCSLRNCQIRSSDHTNIILDMQGTSGYRFSFSDNDISLSTDTTLVKAENGGNITFNNNVVYWDNNNTLPLFVSSAGYINILNNRIYTNGNGSIIKLSGINAEENKISNNVFCSGINYLNFFDPSSTCSMTNSVISENSFLRMTGFSKFGDTCIVENNFIRGTTSITFTGSGVFRNNTFPEVNKATITTGGSAVYGNFNYTNISEIRDAVDTVLSAFGTPRLLLPCFETVGTNIYDYTRLNNSFIASTSVGTWANYLQGRTAYYDFNGSSHYLYRTNDTDFDFGNSVTDSAFSLVVAVNPDNITSRQIIGKWDVNNLREWRLFFDASGYPTLQLYDESVDKYIGRQDQTAFTTGTWQILVATYDGSGICAGCKIYIDGVQLDDADYTDAGYVAMEAVSANLTIGALKNAAAYSEYYDGKMTWIGIAAKELSPDEVWSLTQRLKGVLGV